MSTSGLFGQIARVGYDRLGGLMALNLLWDLAIVPWVALVWFAVAWARASVTGPGLQLTACLAAAHLVLFSGPSALLVAAGGEWLEGRDLNLAHLLKSRRRGLIRSQLLGFGVAAVAAILGANAVFYQGLGGWPGAALAGFMMWMLLALDMVALHLLPVAVAPATAGSAAALRQAATLALRHPFHSVAHLVLCAVVIAAGLVTGIGLFVGFVSALGLLVAAGHRRLMVESQPLPGLAAGKSGHSPPGGA